MSNTVVGVNALITSVTINGVVKTPDGSGNITIPSADATNLFRFDRGYNKGGVMWIVQPPLDPTA